MKQMINNHYTFNIHINRHQEKRSWFSSPLVANILSLIAVIIASVALYKMFYP